MVLCFLPDCSSMYSIQTLYTLLYKSSEFDIIASFFHVISGMKCRSSLRTCIGTLLLLQLLFYFYGNNLSSPPGPADHTNPPGHISLSTVYEEPAVLRTHTPHSENNTVLRRSKVVLIRHLRFKSINSTAIMIRWLLTPTVTVSC